METKVLLSIKPEFVEKIFSGEKKFEYRRSLFKKGNVKSIVIYCSSPVQKVVGEFKIGEIYHSSKDDLWSHTCEYSGISKDFFEKYFIGKENGFAIEIKELVEYPIPKCLNKDFNIAYPPQSFIYIK